MSGEISHSRRRLIGSGGAAILSNAIPGGASFALTAVGPTSNVTTDFPRHAARISANTLAVADYIAGALDRVLPDEVVAATKLHLLDTIAAIVSGSSLKPGEFGARYVESLGGKPQAMVIGTGIVTSVVNAAFANGMAAHADETDDTNPSGPLHLGCASVPAALATAELSGRTGNDLLRAVTLGYDIGERIFLSLGLRNSKSRRYAPTALMSSFVAASAAAAMLRLDQRQVCFALSYAAQQAAGIGESRDLEHMQKAFDNAGAAARNGVMAATMVAMGFTGVDDSFTGKDNIYTAFADQPAPEKLVVGLGTDFAVLGTTIKKWSVGAPLASVLDSMAELLADPAVRADNIKRIRVDVPTETVRIVDNSTIPDLCLQHLVALMIVDRGVTFASVHDVARMSDARVLAVRKLVELVSSEELQLAKPPRQAMVRIETADGRSFANHTVVVRRTPENPMNAKEVEVKALDLMTPVLGAGRARELVVAVAELDSFGPVSGLRRLLLA